MQEYQINVFSALMQVLPSWIYLYLAHFITATIIIIIARFSASDH